MRKLLLLFLCFLFLQAQDYQKPFFISGEFNFSSLDLDVDSETKSSAQFVQLGSELAYILFDNLAAGLNIKLVKNDFENENIPERVSVDITLGPILRYYFWRDKIAPFFQVSASYSDLELFIGEANSPSVEVSSFRYSASLGSNYFINEHISFVGQIIYSFGEVDYGSESITTIPGSPISNTESEIIEEFTEYSINFGLSLHF